MKRLLVVPVLLLLLATCAFADLYQWQDKDGVVHLTNDMNNVPEEYQDKVKVFKTTPRPQAPAPVTAPAPVPAPGPSGGSADLYGDHTLEWWKEAFNRKNQEIGELQSSIAAKQQYIDLFESGRRFGQMYGSTEVVNYNKYKQELPEDQKKLSSLNDELDELRRKATIAGVPKYLRGE
jgi:uncharacterized protein DUF4124